jgi:hypothetical protein
LAISLKKVVAAGLPAGQAIRAILDTEEGGLLLWAAKAELSYTSLSGLLRGTARTRYLREREALAKRFKVDLDWLAQQLP